MGSLYEQVMGQRFARLPAAVRRFHTISGQRKLEGWVETAAPASPLARWMALCLGTPQAETQGPIRFELDASSDQETWTRHFPSHSMISRLRKVGEILEEKLGVATLRFALLATDAGLEMELRSMAFLGIPCPRWLLPSIVAKEYGEGDAIHFCVSAALPLLGTVARYRGHLVLSPETPP